MSKRAAKFPGSDDLSDGAQKFQRKAEGKTNAGSKHLSITELLNPEQTLQIERNDGSHTAEASSQTTLASNWLAWPSSTPLEQHAPAEGSPAKKDSVENGWIYLGTLEHPLFIPDSPFASLSPEEQRNTRVLYPKCPQKYIAALKFKAVDSENLEDILWLCRRCMSHGIPYITRRTGVIPKGDTRSCHVCSIDYCRGGEYLYGNAGMARVPITENKSEARMWCCISCSVLEKRLVIQPIDQERCFRRRTIHTGVIYLT